MKTYAEYLRAQMFTQQSSQAVPSKRVIQLATQINAWHEKRIAPERWQPVMLGRLAALLGISRELTAAALQYAGWKESRKSNTSLWLPQTNLTMRNT